MNRFNDRRLPKLIFVRQGSRAGTTLPEVLVFISVSSVLLTVVAIWLHKLLLFSNTLMERQRDHVNLNHVATDLRQDVMFAKSWSFPDSKEPDRLELTMSDNSKIQYHLVRESHGSKIHTLHLPASDLAAVIGEVDAGNGNGKQVSRQETYRFSPGCRLQWENSQFPESLSLIAFRVPALANPLPKKSVSDIKPASQSQGSQNSNSSADLVSSAAIETIIRLSPDRWAGRVRFVPEGSQ